MNEQVRRSYRLNVTVRLYFRRFVKRIGQQYRSELSEVQLLFLEKQKRI